MGSIGTTPAGKSEGATWILEGDITSCFDNISHGWMEQHILMAKDVLHKCLGAGYVADNRLYPRRKGTPQGAIISPCLSNRTLDGLERVVREAVPRRSRVNFVRYADDFIAPAPRAAQARARSVPGRAWSDPLRAEDRNHAYQTRFHIPRANLPQARQCAALEVQPPGYPTGVAFVNA